MTMSSATSHHQQGEQEYPNGSRYSGQYPEVPEFQRPWEHIQVPQGLWKYADSQSAQSLVSGGFSQCYGAVMRSGQQIVMVHAEPLLASETYHSCQTALRSRGSNWRAILFKGTQSSPHMDIEELLTSVGGVVDKIIQLETGKVHWGLAYRCRENLFFVDQSANKTLLTFQGFQ